ncbi:related to F1F0-ATP synthase subunit G [Claviceps purpurea 20.1]|uniref:Related to F1F0-ATP synthase subunit G n=1 Tax=Claviceps purpurea (strain 20.1) TaxID=1111077 RepID=M1W0P0_CLAP2|nr:related to F1F0-ATP synthase subunit G [Claviceps purpurea 20.1]
MSLARPMLRSPALRMASRRFESTATSKAAEGTKEVASKAQDGLSRVVGAAGGVARGLGQTLSKIGGRTGRVIAFIERQTPFVVYYSKVTAEVAKTIYHGQRMSLPSISAFQAVYRGLWRSALNRTLFPSPRTLLQNAREEVLEHGTEPLKARLATGTVIGLQCVGFFTVGEMLGRFKLVGYHGEPASHH